MCCQKSKICLVLLVLLLLQPWALFGVSLQPVENVYTLTESELQELEQIFIAQQMIIERLETRLDAQRTEMSSLLQTLERQENTIGDLERSFEEYVSGVRRQRIQTGIRVGVVSLVVGVIGGFVLGAR